MEREVVSVCILPKSEVEHREVALTSATIFVNGIGQITIKDCISATTIENLQKEIIFVLNQKLGNM